MVRALAILAALTGLTALPGASGAEPPPPRSQITRVVHRPQADLPSIGPRHAPVTIEFFANLGDGATTASVHRLLMQLHERHPRRLRIVYRLISMGEQSNPHLEAGQEAFVQGRFRAFIDELYAGTYRSPRASELPEIAARAGMDPRQLEEALADGRHAPAIRANHFYRKRQRVRRVADLLINGVVHGKRPRTIDELEAAYDEAYARARELIDGGVPLEKVHGRLLDQVAADKPPPVVVPGAVDGLRPGERPPVGPAPLVVIPVTGDELARGPEDAPVPILFFCNFQTKNCGEMAWMLDQIAAAYPEVRVVFRTAFDPSDRRQSRARDLHEAAVCAEEQHRFWPFYDGVFRRARQGRTDTADPIEDLAAALELDGKQFSRCLESPATRRQVEAARRAARAAGVRHTPAVVVGGRLYTGTKSFEDLAGLVDRELLPGVLGRLAPD